MMYFHAKGSSVSHVWNDKGTKCGRYKDINIKHKNYNLSEDLGSMKICGICLISSGEKNFYSSQSWLNLRYQVLLSSNRKCSCCGRSAETHGISLHVDHIKPRSKYPELKLNIDNLQVLCGDCNFGKGSSDETDWR